MKQSEMNRLQRVADAISGGFDGGARDDYYYSLAFLGIKERIEHIIRYGENALEPPIFLNIEEADAVCRYLDSCDLLDSNARYFAFEGLGAGAG